MMMHSLKYREPYFNREPFISAPDVVTELVVQCGVAPENYHATTIFPEYYRINGRWVLAGESRMDCVAVVKDDGELEIKEFRRLEVGERVCRCDRISLLI